VSALRTIGSAVHLVLNPTDAAATIQISARGRLDIDVADLDILAHRRTRALQIPNKRVVFLTCRALEVLDLDIADSQIRRELIAKRDVLLSVALRDLDRVVDIVNNHSIVGHILDFARTASALQILGKRGRSTRPHLDARTVGGVGHGDVGDVDVLHDVDFALVLAEGAHADSVRAVADQVLHHDVCGVGFERDAVVPIVDVRVLDNHVAAAVCVPAVGVLGWILALAAAEDVDAREQHVGGIGEQSVPLRAVAQVKVFDSPSFQADDAHQDGAQNQCVLRVEIVPGLAVTVKGTAAVNVDILTTELEEGGRVLKSLVESILLPVVGVVGELNGPLNVCRVTSAWSSQDEYTKTPTEIDVLKESQVQRCADGVVLLLGEDHMTAVVALLNSFQDVLGIILAAATRPDRANLLPCRRHRERLSWVIRSNRGLGSLRGGSLIIAFLNRRSNCHRGACKCEKLRDTHVDDGFGSESA
jgi:hypothetical protein